MKILTNELIRSRLVTVEQLSFNTVLASDMKDTDVAIQQYLNVLGQVLSMEQFITEDSKGVTEDIETEDSLVCGDIDDDFCDGECNCGCSK